MRTRIYDDKDIVIYAKRDVYVGEEIDLGGILIEVGLINVGKFSEHLEESVKESFLKEVKDKINNQLEDVKKRFI